MSTPIVQIQVQRAPGDCAIAALSMYLGVPYEDVLGAAVQQTKRRRVHHVGMYTRDIKATAKRLGVRLHLRRAVDLEVDEGVLAVQDDVQEHAVLLKAGLIFDGDGLVWEPSVFMAHYHYRPMSLLVTADE